MTYKNNRFTINSTFCNKYYKMLNLLYRSINNSIADFSRYRELDEKSAKKFDDRRLFILKDKTIVYVRIKI